MRGIMAAIKCAGCGGLTNTAVCNWTEPDIRGDRKAHECYIRVEGGVWVRGCGWDRADPHYGKPLYEKYLGRKA